MTDPVSDLAACRQRLDVLEQQAKAATPGPWDFAGSDEMPYGVGRSGRPGYIFEDMDCRIEDDVFIAAWNPAAVLALCGWIRQTLDGAEAQLGRHREKQCKCTWAGEFFAWAKCPEYHAAASVIAGLAAVLAPDQAVKP